MTASGNDQLVPDGSKLFLSLLAALLGFACPVGAAAASVSKDVLEFVQSRRSRRDQRRFERLRLLVVTLESRVGHLERQADDDAVDLILEVVRKAVEDDEDRKSMFYAGLLEWIIKKKPTPAQVRVLSDGVRMLSFIELAFFSFEVDGRSARFLVEPELPDSLVISRLETAGISSGGVRYNGSPTTLGRALAEYCPIVDVDRLLTSTERLRHSRA